MQSTPMLNVTKALEAFAGNTTALIDAYRGNISEDILTLVGDVYNDNIPVFSSTVLPPGLTSSRTVARVLARTFGSTHRYVSATTHTFCGTVFTIITFFVLRRVSCFIIKVVGDDVPGPPFMKEAMSAVQILYHYTKNFDGAKPGVLVIAMLGCFIGTMLNYGLEQMRRKAIRIIPSLSEVLSTDVSTIPLTTSTDLAPLPIDSLIDTPPDAGIGAPIIRYTPDTLKTVLMPKVTVTEVVTTTLTTVPADSVASSVVTAVPDEPMILYDYVDYDSEAGLTTSYYGHSHEDYVPSDVLAKRGFHSAFSYSITDDYGSGKVYGLNAEHRDGWFAQCTSSDMTSKEIARKINRYGSTKPFSSLFSTKNFGCKVVARGHEGLSGAIVGTKSEGFVSYGPAALQKIADLVFNATYPALNNLDTGSFNGTELLKGVFDLLSESGADNVQKASQDEYDQFPGDYVDPEFASAQADWLSSVVKPEIVYHTYLSEGNATGKFLTDISSVYLNALGPPAAISIV